MVSKYQQFSKHNKRNYTTISFCMNTELIEMMDSLIELEKIFCNRSHFLEDLVRRYIEDLNEVLIYGAYFKSEIE